MNSVKPREWFVLTGFLAATFAASAIGGIATASSVSSWYPTLIKPSWNPPASVFAPVWTILYVMIAIAGWRTWRRLATPASRPAARAVLTGFFVQLALNALWSVLFFGLRRPDLAFIEIVALWAALFWMQIRLTRLDRTAAWLWLPYLLWVSFATALNFAIWRLNS
jgi:translocator protein